MASEPELSAVVRARSAVRTEGPDRRLGASSWLRSRIGVDLAGTGVGRLFVQLQDARQFGEEVSTMDAAADGLDLHQAYLELSDDWSGLAARVRVGRQEIRWGSERLVGAVGWSNTARSFDGARMDLTSPDDAWKLEALTAVVADRDGANLDSNDRLLSGLRAEAGPAALSVLREDGYRVGSALVDRPRHTIHGSASPELPLGFSLRLEGAYQWGDRPAGDLSSGLAAVRLVHSRAESVLSRISVGADWLSGDAAPGDSRHTAFSTLFATNHKFYGYQDFFLNVPSATGERGLVDLRAGVTAALRPGIDLRIEPHMFLTAEPTVSGARALGRELDVTLPVRVSESTAVQAGYSAFWPDRAARDVGLVRGDGPRHWGYLQTRVAF